MFKRKTLFSAVVFLTILVVLFLFQSPCVRNQGAADDSAVGSLTADSLNVVLITLDTTRPDRLGCYGYKDANTPNIDWVAKQGTIFTQAIAPVPITLPSHCSILTGLDMFSHGVRENGTFYLKEGFTTLAETLKRNGYKTAAVTASFVLDRRFGLDQGFDFYEDNLEGNLQAVPKRVWQGHKYGRFERPAGEVSDIAVSWLRANHKSKMFIWIHFFDPHAPYDPPQNYRVSNEEHVSKLYDGEIAYVDRELGRILDELKKKSLIDRTLIIIASDHGEVLGEHTLFYTGRKYVGHAQFAYEQELKTALIFKLPNIIPKAKQIKQMVKVSDVTPTILDILKIEEEIKFDGKSLYPLIMGDTTKNLTELYCETMQPNFRLNKSPVHALRTEKYKVIYLPGEETVLLYDIVKDPGEHNNLFSSKNKEHVGLFNKTLSYVKRIDSKESHPTREMDEETIEKLKSLGYVK